MFVHAHYEKILYAWAHCMSVNLNAGNTLWVAIIEKAYAKLHGCYSAITSGNVHQAFHELTGAPSYLIDLHADDIDTEVIWAQLLSFRQSGFLMGASCGNSQADAKTYEAVGLQKGKWD